jgi:hypothetical protein
MSSFVERTSGIQVSEWSWDEILEKDCISFQMSECHNYGIYETIGAFTLDVKSMLNENLGGILDDTQCSMGHSSMLSEC